MKVLDDKIQALDIGYGSIKGWAGRGEPWRLPSLFGWLQADQEVGELGPDTRRCAYLDGPAAAALNLAGREWLVGANALASGNLKAVAGERDKTRVLPLLVFGGLRLPSELRTGDAYTLKRLVLSVPDANSTTTDRLTSLLTGEHHIAIDGSELLLDIKAVSIRHEGEGIYAYCQRQGLVDPETTTLLLDIGMGTVIASVFGHGSRRALARWVYPESGEPEAGVIALLNSMARDPELQRLVGTTEPDKVLLREAIESGSYRYGGRHLDIAPVFMNHRPAWLRRIIQAVLNGLGPWDERISRIILCGGGAHLEAGLLLDGDYLIACDQPVFANVLGLVEPSAVQLIKAAG